MRETIKRLAQWSVRARRPVDLADLVRTSPISRSFGLDRGTPLDRYYIHQFVETQQPRIIGEGLEVGELRYLNQYRHQLKRRCILVPDISVLKPGHGADDVVVADLQRVDSVPEERFDCFLCTQTLNFIFDVKEAIVSAHKLLRPGGSFIGTVAGISQISRYDMDRWGDYWRFTQLSMRRLLEERFPDVSIQTAGNALSAQLFLQGVALEDVADRAALEVCDADYPVIVGFCATKS